MPSWLQVTVTSHCGQKVQVCVTGGSHRIRWQRVQHGVLSQHKNGVPGKHHDPLWWPQGFSCLSSLSACLLFSLNYFTSLQLPLQRRAPALHGLAQHHSLSAAPATLGLLAAPGTHKMCSGLKTLARTPLILEDKSF